MRYLSLEEAREQMNKAAERETKIEAVEDALHALWNNEDDGDEDKSKYQSLFHAAQQVQEDVQEAITSMSNANYSEGYCTQINYEDVIIYYSKEDAEAAEKAHAAE